MAKAVDTKEWRETLVQLPSVISVEFTCEDGSLSEIHVLSDDRRQAKQISRDIQSAMAARFGVAVDHKIISVAQIRSNDPHPQKRVLYCGFESTHTGGGYSLSVQLQYAGAVFTGRSDGAISASEKPLAIARAAANALNQIISKRGTITVEEVRTLDLTGERVILVCVKLIALQRAPEKLVGCCYSRGDSEIAIIRATLDAVNRRFDTI